MYLALERFFCRTFRQHSTSFTRHRHVAKTCPLSICKKVLFHGPRKKTPCRLKQSLKTFPAICGMIINNSCQKLLAEPTIKEELQETFTLAAMFVNSLARGKKTEH